MEHIYKEFKNEDYEKSLLNLLNNHVFHLTTIKALESILKDSYIFHNRNNRFPLNCSSTNSLGRKKGCICLFDLRDTKDSIIQETLECYYFLGPSWFRELFEDHTEHNLAYLILEAQYYNLLIPNEEGWKEYNKTKKLDQFIPKTECWFKGDLPIDYISKVIHVKIYKDAPPKNSFLYLYHQMALNDYPTKKSESI